MSNRSDSSNAITVIAPLRRGFFAYFWRFWLAGIVFPQVRRTVWMMQLDLLSKRPKLSEWVKREVLGGWQLPLVVAAILAGLTGWVVGTSNGWAIASVVFALVFLAGFPLRVSIPLVVLLAPLLGWLTRLLSLVGPAGAQYALPVLVMAPVLLLVFWPSTRYQEGLYQLGFLHSGQWFIVRPTDILRADPKARVRRWYLWFSANFNGPWDPYIEAFSKFIPGGLNLLYRPIEGFPLASPFYPFNRWIRFNQSTAAHYYSAYGQHTTKDIRGALTFAGAMNEFIEQRMTGRHHAQPETSEERRSRMWGEYARLLRVIHRDPRELESDRPKPEPPEPETFPQVKRYGFWKDGLARRNQSGQAYCLNVLTGIEPHHQHELNALLTALSDAPGGSPFETLGRIHNARFVVLNDLKHQGRPTLGKRLVFPLAFPLGLQAFSNRPLGIDEDHLPSPQLFFSCTFDGVDPRAAQNGRITDGGLESFLDQVWELRNPHGHGRLADAIWGRSRPDPDGRRDFGENRDEFVRYILDHQIHNSTFFLDSPNPLAKRTFTVSEINRALALQEFFVSFAYGVQRCKEEEDPGRYVDALAPLVDRIKNLPERQDRAGQLADRVVMRDIMASLGKNVVDPQRQPAEALAKMFTDFDEFFQKVKVERQETAQQDLPRVPIGAT